MTHHRALTGSSLAPAFGRAGIRSSTGACKPAAATDVRGSITTLTMPDARQIAAPTRNVTVYPVFAGKCCPAGV